MKIKLTAISKFQRYFPSRSLEVDFPGRTMTDLLAWVEKEYGLAVSDHRNVKVVHNSTLARDFSVELKDGDSVSFVPIVAGG